MCWPVGRQEVIVPGGEYAEEARLDATGGDVEAIFTAMQVVSQGTCPPVVVAINICILLNYINLPLFM
jgi:hypothetical protein